MLTKSLLLESCQSYYFFLSGHDKNTSDWRTKEGRLSDTFETEDGENGFTGVDKALQTIEQQDEYVQSKLKNEINQRKILN